MIFTLKSLLDFQGIQTIHRGPRRNKQTPSDIKYSPKSGCRFIFLSVLSMSEVTAARNSFQRWHDKETFRGTSLKVTPDYKTDYKTLLFHTSIPWSQTVLKRAETMSSMSVRVFRITAAVLWYKSTVFRWDYPQKKGWDLGVKCFCESLGYPLLWCSSMLQHQNAFSLLVIIKRTM